MTRTLRPHQQEAYARVQAEWDSGIVRTAVVHATGLGKGDLIAKMVTDEARAGGRALVICHRAEVLDQLTARCAAYAPTVPVGRVQSARNEVRRPVTMAMIQTLAREKRQARLPRPSLVVIDECHRASADGYVRTLAWAGSFDRTRTLGLTATLVRGDKRGLGDVFQSVADSRDIRWGIDAGLLVEPRGKVVVTQHLNLDTAKVSRGDYTDSDLGEMVSQDVEEIAKAWVSHAQNRITIAFAPTVDSAHALRDAFLAQGVAAEAVTGSTPTREREGMYARLATGETRVLVNVFVLVEGFDVAAVSCVLMARPTRLPGVYTQAVGRALRPHPGKDSALVLDVVGTSRRQKLMTLIDLHQTAEVDTSEIDTLPCEECGGASRGCPLSDAAPFQCRCADGDGIERGPARLLGPAEYEDLDDLFAASSFAWLFTLGGTRFLAAGDRMAVLWPEGEGYLSGHCTVRGYDQGRYVGRDGQWIDRDPLPLPQAKALAEAWAGAHDPSISSRSASWRKRGGQPSEAQLAMARRCGVREPETMGKSRLSDEISISLASRVLDS